MKILRTGLLALSFALLQATGSLAATVNLASPTGTVFMIQDGSGNNLNLGGICGAASATLETNCAYQWYINSAGQGLVLTAGEGATASSVPADAIYLGYNLGGNLTGATGNADGGLNIHIVGQSGNLTFSNPSAGLTGAAVPTTAAFIAARAENAEPTPTTNNSLTGLAVGLEGKLITLPFANKENMVRGSASATGTSATTLIAAQGSGVKIYVTAVECFNTSASATYVTLNDTEGTGSGTTIGVPPSNPNSGSLFPTPLVIAANTALTFTPAGATTTLYCNAQGYAGS